MLCLSGAAHAAWDFKEIVDPMSDAKRGITSVDGEGGSIVIKCDTNGAGTLYVQFMSKDYIGEGRNGQRQMKYRVDGGEVVSVPAYHNAKSALLFDTKPGSVGAAFLSKLVVAKKVVTDTTDYQYGSHVAIYDVAGAAEAVKKAAITCGDTNWM